MGWDVKTTTIETRKRSWLDTFILEFNFYNFMLGVNITGAFAASEGVFDAVLWCASAAVCAIMMVLGNRSR
jgi:hypothetical protein